MRFVAGKANPFSTEYAMSSHLIEEFIRPKQLFRLTFVSLFFT